MEWYLAVLNKYATFEGRARCKEYWMFVLVNFVIAFVIGFIGGLAKSKAIVGLGNIYQLAVLVPGIAVGVRRMHDVNKSGWYLLIPIYNLILLISAGEEGPNPYGPDPKQDQTSTQSMNSTQANFAPINNEKNVVEQLEKLAHLKAKGYITEDEFLAKKKQLLVG